MRGNQKTAQIIMLEDLDKDQKYEKTSNVKRKCSETEQSGSRQTMNIELEKFTIDLSYLISEPAVEAEEVECTQVVQGRWSSSEKIWSLA